MYERTSLIEGKSLDALVGYSPKMPLFTLSDAVNEGYSCEGCQKILGRMYGTKGLIEMDHLEPSHHAEGKEYGKVMVSPRGYQGLFNGEYGSHAGSAISYKGAKKADPSYQALSKTYEFQPTVFLKPNRPETPFVENENQIMELARETFLQLTGTEIPSNISISILPKEELKRKHGEFGKWSDGIQGFAVNGAVLKQVFVKQDHLDSVMMVLGHEIGHVFTPSLSNQHDEEAKAFSFAEAWAKCIKKHDIGGLAQSIKDESDWQPACNGLHDVAFNFVQRMIRKGVAPMDLHWDLAKRYRSLFNAYQ
jgi:hypothetical protein